MRFSYYYFTTSDNKINNIKEIAVNFISILLKKDIFFQFVKTFILRN